MATRTESADASNVGFTGSVARSRRHAKEADDDPCGTMSAMPLVPIYPQRVLALAGVPYAFPYQGSKRQLAHSIVQLIPQDTTTLYEPFAGSAALSIAARHLRLTKEVHLSDINAPLMSLWKEILQRPDRLSDDYESLWNEQLSDPRSFYDQIRNKFNSTHEPRFLLYLLSRCVKAAVRYNKNGQFNQGADHRRLGVKPIQMRNRLQRTAHTLSGASVKTADYADILKNANTDAVVYMDPPYEGVSHTRDHRYMQGIKRAQFESTLENAVKHQVSFIVSYDGATGNKSHGTPLSSRLGLLHLYVHAGTSSQATLQGFSKDTIESLYVSPALVDRLDGEAEVRTKLADPGSCEVTALL